MKGALESNQRTNDHCLCYRFSNETSHRASLPLTLETICSLLVCFLAPNGRNDDI